MKVAMVQMKVVKEKAQNLQKAIAFIGEAAKKGADMVVLPEMFCCPYQTEAFPVYAEPENGDIAKVLSHVAKLHGLYVVAGSMPEIDENKNIYNTSYVFDPQGSQIAKHRKMHLFDINIKNGQAFRESDTLTPGNTVTVFDTKFGKMGLCICYDIRFPELFRLMVDQGAKAIFVPAAFNMTTGPIHWELAFRSRALDNQVYTLGVAPARDMEAGYVSYANSLCASPWGDVIARLEEKEGYCIVELDFEQQEAIREQLPLLHHRRKDIYSLSLV